MFRCFYLFSGFQITKIYSVPNKHGCPLCCYYIIKWLADWHGQSFFSTASTPIAYFHVCCPPSPVCPQPAVSSSMYPCVLPTFSCCLPLSVNLYSQLLHILQIFLFMWPKNGNYIFLFVRASLCVHQIKVLWMQEVATLYQVSWINLEGGQKIFLVFATFVLKLLMSLGISRLIYVGLD